MKELRIGINSNFAIQRWTEPQEWMSMIHNDFELDLVEFSLSLLDAQMEEPSRLVYIQELNELCDTYNIQIHNIYVDNILNGQNGLFHQDLGRRISAIKFYEQCLDITAGLSAFTFGLNVGSYPEEILNNSQKISYFNSFLIDSLVYISRVGYTAGIGAVLIDPLQVNGNLHEYNKTLINEYKKSGRVPLQFVANSGQSSFDKLIQEFKSAIGLFHVPLDPAYFLDTTQSNKIMAYKKSLESIITRIRNLNIPDSNITLQIEPSFQMDSNSYKNAVKTAITYMKSL